MVNYKSAIHKIYLKKLNQKVQNIRDVSRGLENKVYVVKTNKATTIIRIPKEGKPPFAGKHQALREYWASKAWGKLGIPVPKIITLDESRKLVKFDYIIETYIPGKNLDKVKLDEKQMKAVMRKTGKFLRKMHKVKTKKYGLLVSYKIGEHKKWARVITPEIKRTLRNLQKKKILPNKTIKQMREYFKEKEDVLDFHNPSLLHNDISGDNIRIQNEKIIGIIDFGDAYSGDPMFDVARTYQGLYEETPFVNEFLKGYGKINKKRFNYFLLYHASWVLGWCYEHKYKKCMQECKEMINLVLSSKN